MPQRMMNWLELSIGRNPELPKKLTTVWKVPLFFFSNAVISSWAILSWKDRRLVLINWDRLMSRFLRFSWFSVPFESFRLTFTPNGKPQKLLFIVKSLLWMFELNDFLKELQMLWHFVYDPKTFIIEVRSWIPRSSDVWVDWVTSFDVTIQPCQRVKPYNYKPQTSNACQTSSHVSSKSLNFNVILTTKFVCWNQISQCAIFGR